MAAEPLRTVSAMPRQNFAARPSAEIRRPAFEEVEAGRTFVVSMKSKRYRFAPQVVSVTADVNKLVFVAQS